MKINQYPVEKASYNEYVQNILGLGFHYAIDLLIFSIKFGLLFLIGMSIGMHLIIQLVKDGYIKIV